MDAKLLLDPAYGCFLEESSTDWTLASLAEIRNRINQQNNPLDATGYEQRWTIDTQARTGIRLCIYRPERAVAGQALPVILYVHGGGFVLGSPEMAGSYLAELATARGAVVVAVDYRLAPEHPFPAPLEDCYAVLDWIARESHSLGVDFRKLVIMGHSAGSGLAAALAILARDRGQYRAAGLVLIYPMLDHRTGSATCASDNPTTGRLGWSRVANQFCWRCLQGSYDLRDDRAPLFSPSLALDLQGLPPSFICVGALDLFLEEATDFALKLSRSAVPVELHVYPGVPHMFDQHPGEQTDRCRGDVAAALKRMWRN